MELHDLAKAPQAMRHLLMPRPFAPPSAITWDPSISRLYLDTGYDQLSLVVAQENAEWLLAADALGGLMVRISPSFKPHQLTIYASWEGQLLAFTAEVA